MEEISRTERVTKEELLHRVEEEEEMNILQIKRRKFNWLVTSCVGTAV